MTTLEDEDALAARAGAGDHAAFDTLCALHDRAVYGYLRVRSRSDDDAREVAQEARLELWSHARDFDPQRAPYRAFALHWAWIVLMRFYRARMRRQRVEVLFSELATRFGDAADEKEVGEIADWLSAREAEAPVPTGHAPEAYEALLLAVMSLPLPPHQIIVFGFCKLVRYSDGAGPQRVSGKAGPSLAHLGRTKPSDIVSRLSAVPLRELEARLEDAYLHESELSDAVVRRCFEPLRCRMDAAATDMRFARDAGIGGKPASDRSIGDTTLGDYYAARAPAAAVSHWWSTVQRRALDHTEAFAAGFPEDVLVQKKEKAPGEKSATPPHTGRRRPS